MAIGKYVEKTVNRRDEKDEQGNVVKEGAPEVVLDFVSNGVVTNIEDALALVNGDEQVLFDCFADGFNERQYANEVEKDELDEFIVSMGLDDEQKKVFKRTARNLMNNYGYDALEAAGEVKSFMEKAKAKAEKIAAEKAAANSVPA